MLPPQAPPADANGWAGGYQEASGRPSPVVDDEDSLVRCQSASNSHNAFVTCYNYTKYKLCTRHFVMLSLVWLDPPGTSQQFWYRTLCATHALDLSMRWPVQLERGDLGARRGPHRRAVRPAAAALHAGHGAVAHRLAPAAVTARSVGAGGLRLWPATWQVFPAKMMACCNIKTETTFWGLADAAA